MARLCQCEKGGKNGEKSLPFGLALEAAGGVEVHDLVVLHGEVMACRLQVRRLHTQKQVL